MRLLIGKSSICKVVGGCAVAMALAGLVGSAEATPGNGKGNHFGWGKGNGNSSRPAPAPLLGLGIPAAGGALLALFLAKRSRRKL
jgi:hypothetical protein